jgi:hypothetical protein
VLLSGPGKNLLTLDQLAGTLSTLRAREVRLHVVSVDEYVARHTRDDGEPRGEPAFLREWATTYAAIARGDAGAVDPLLERVLGRPARAMVDCLKESLGAAEGGAIAQYAK